MPVAEPHGEEDGGCKDGEPDADATDEPPMLPGRLAMPDRLVELVDIFHFFFIIIAQKQ